MSPLLSAAGFVKKTNKTNKQTKHGFPGGFLKPKTKNKLFFLTLIYLVIMKWMDGWIKPKTLDFKDPEQI